MANYFLRGLKRIFGVRKKPKHKLAPYGSIARPKIVLEYTGKPKKEEKINIEEYKSQKKTAKKKTSKKKVSKKKL
ncbi:MAG: hypothetical protein KC516_03035 [Nanoarchaeota archaeon]|nr:hypothetical protein [Nanoarchaeota archaeon]